MGMSAGRVERPVSYAPTEDAHLRVLGLTLGYGESVVLHELDFAHAAGQVLALVGANGCGKTTLLRGLAGLIDPLAGTIVRDGGGGRSPAGVLFQNEMVAPFTVRELVTLGLGVNGRPSLPQRQRVEAILTELDLDGLAERHCGQLSGGEWQRTRVARALVAKPNLLLFDEPTNHLDPARRAECFALLDRLRGNVSIVLATHDLELAAQADQVLLLVEGRLLASGAPGAVLTTALLRQALGVDVRRWDPPDGSAPFYRVTGRLA
jgi:iron complex transport system ATP-binding protein